VSAGVDDMRWDGPPDEGPFVELCRSIGAPALPARVRELAERARAGR
jgi:hypothetical protein